jgi:hypothetical protein
MPLLDDIPDQATEDFRLSLVSEFRPAVILREVRGESVGGCSQLGGLESQLNHSALNEFGGPGDPRVKSSQNWTSLTDKSLHFALLVIFGPHRALETVAVHCPKEIGK